ncbi:interferon alpha-inducible protein 27-like protein 2 [Echinops telfairi]|uniref:Interferon alpha-inducible protein 27-like protein 2 n=1 Tax=Echinops telfairi TaxID=9371 RepID=A0ABM0IHL3_ECHTE|nr:interferon alpha-inducible protein 27-like protein 2 [Echinops telfairi]
MKRVAVVSVPAVLSALGFTGAGIMASSIAAKMMLAAAVANGGWGGPSCGRQPGATLQSVGTAGLSTSSNILLGTAGSAVGAYMGHSKKKPSPPWKETRQGI